MPKQTHSASPRAQLQSAHRKLISGDAKAALNELLALLQKHPDYAAALQLVGIIFSSLGNQELARVHFLRGLELLPDDPTMLKQYANSCVATKRSEAGISVLERFLEASKGDAEIYAMLSTLTEEAGDLAKSRDAIEAAALLEPSNALYQRLLANAEERAGNLPAAATALHAAYLLEPHNPVTLYHICLLPNELCQIDLVEALQNGRKSKKEKGRSEEEYFTKAEIVLLLRQGKYAEAFDKNCRFKKAVNPTAPEIHAKMADQRDAALTKLKFEKPLKSRANKELGSTEPLLILGASRSGKSTVESLLAHSEHVSRGFESGYVLSAIRSAWLKAGYTPEETLSAAPDAVQQQFPLEMMARVARYANGRAVHTTTVPQNIKDCYDIAKLVPNSKVICVRRNPLDVAFRQFFRFYVQGNLYSNDIATARDYSKWYDDMIVALAEKLPGRCLVVSYDELVGSTRETVEKLYDFVGLALPVDFVVPDLPDDRGFARRFEGIANLQ